MRYVPIRTNTLRAEATLLFDVYVLFEDCYLKYRGAKDIFDAKVLERLKAKKVKKVYILEEHEPSYLAYLDQALDSLSAAGQSVTAKAELAQGAMRQESESIAKTLETEKDFRRSEARIQKVVDFFVAEPKALAGMLAAEGLSVDDSAHGSAVSTLALAVGTTCGYLGRDELTDIAVAGLLHDSALKAIGLDVRTSIENVPREKKAELRRHPELAVEAVAGKKFITPRVLRIISDHEEYGEGLGYPGRKNYNRLQMDSKVFNLCDAFDHHCITTGKAAAEAADSFIESRGGHFDEELVGILEAKIKG